LVQTFLKKWWVESDFKAPNLPLSLHIESLMQYINIDVKKVKKYENRLEIFNLQQIKTKI
jgi:hypothetical protein